MMCTAVVEQGIIILTPAQALGHLLLQQHCTAREGSALSSLAVVSAKIRRGVRSITHGCMASLMIMHASCGGLHIIPMPLMRFDAVKLQVEGGC